MFVIELDRPWLDTPFLLQGFLIETQEDLATLRKYCQSVIVDPTRSVGDQYEGKASWRPELRQVEPLPISLKVQSAPPKHDFHKVLRALQKQEKALRSSGGDKLAARPVPKLQPGDQQSIIEEEIVYVAPFYDELRDSMRKAVDTLQTDGTPDFGRVKENISEVVRSIERNPSAAIWLTQLRCTQQYAYDHTLDVSVYMVVFGRFLGMSEKTLELLGLAALMLDVGKSRISPVTLTKTGPLSPAEFALIKTHVAESFDMYKSTSNPAPSILPIIAQHHERHDGSGYPKGLAGKDICLHAEMAGVIDTYCAMIRLRPYRAPISTQRGLEHLVKMRGTQFRDLLVDQFIQCIGIYPVGSIVELSSGEIAIVVMQNRVRRLKPCVMILLGPDKKPDPRPRTLDLIYDPIAPTGEHYRVVRALPSDAYGINPSDFFLD